MDEEYILSGRELGGYLNMITNDLEKGVYDAVNGSETRQKAAERIVSILPGSQLTLGFILIDRLCSIKVPDYIHPESNTVDYWEDSFGSLNGLELYPWDELKNFYLIRNRFTHSLKSLDGSRPKADKQITDFLRMLEEREEDAYYQIQDNLIILEDWKPRFRNLISRLYNTLHKKYVCE